MIPFDFEYYKPASLIEAVKTFQYLDLQGKQPVYYAGGTEIITLARINRLFTGAVIDIKRIPECQTLRLQDGRLVIGAAVTLTGLAEANLFPLLSKTASGAADHTARNKITVGGNICGAIFYREAVLPFLLADSQVVLAGPQGIRYAPIHQIFIEKLQLEKGEFLVQIITDRIYTTLPFVSIKQRKQGKVGYPLVTVAALKKDGRIRVAFSGLCSFPFRSLEMEQALNSRQLPPEVRITRALMHLPAPILHDIQGSVEYREFVLRNTLLDIIGRLEGGAHAAQ